MILLAEFSNCDRVPYKNPCTEVILTSNIDKIIDNCNFTFSTGEHIINTLWGTLIQWEVLSIKELDQETIVLGTIPINIPIFITTSALLNTLGGPLELLIRPSNFYESRYLNCRHLDSTQIKNLR